MNRFIAEWAFPPHPSLIILDICPRCLPSILTLGHEFRQWNFLGGFNVYVEQCH